MTTPMLVDMHCHLDRMANGDELACELAACGLACFCNTVTPGEAVAARERFAACENVRVGVGLHPWWVARVVGAGVAEDTLSPSGSSAASLASSAEFSAEYPRSASTLVSQAVLSVRSVRSVGEVGLDFSAAYADSRAEQIEAFDAVMHACSEHPVQGRVISIHAVRAADEVLDILQRYGVTGQAACIFHWFSGTSDELARARKMGCWFSVGERMLATRRGREYARQIPIERLLIETDAPTQLDTAYSAGEWVGSLNRTVELLAQIRGCDQGTLARTVAQSSSTLLGI